MTTSTSTAPPVTGPDEPRPVWALAAAAVGLLGGVGFMQVAEGAGVIAAGLLLVGCLVGAVVLSRPEWAVAAVFAAPAIGGRPLPGGSGLQVVHVVCVSAILVTALAVVAGAPLRRLRRRELRPALVGAGTLVLAAIVSTLLTGDTAMVVRGLKVTATFAAGALVLLAVVVVADTARRRRTLLAAAVLGSLSVTLPILAHPNRLSVEFGGAVVRGRAQSTFADPNQFGCYAALVVLLALGWAIAATSRTERALAVLGGTTAAAALALSLSRGAWLGTAAGLLVFAATHPRCRRLLLGGVLTVGTVSVLALAVAPPAGPLTAIVDRAAVIDDRAANPHDVRPVTWREAIRQFTVSPLVGNGPGAFSTLAAGSPSRLQFAPRLHAHNALLNTAADLGAVGVLSGLTLVAGLAAAAFAGVRRLRAARDWSELGVLAGGCGALAALSVHLLVDYPLRNPVLMIAAWAIAGLVLAAVPKAVRP